MGRRPMLAMALGGVALVVLMIVTSSITRKLYGDQQPRPKADVYMSDYFGRSG